MDNLNDIKKIWHTANTAALPGVDKIRSVIKKHRRNKLLKLTAVIITALFLIAVMVTVMFNYKSAMISTRVGEVCIMAACLILLIANARSLKRFYRYNDYSNKEFIAFLEETRVRRSNYYKRTQVVGLAIASAGLLLYIYEEARRHDLWVGLTAYSVAIAYMLIIWLVIRPRAFKRQNRKLDETIKKLNALSKQF